MSIDTPLSYLTLKPPVEIPPVEPPDVTIIYPAGETPADEEDKEGWFLTLLKAGLKSLAEWLVESVIRPVLTGAVWLMDWIRAELRYWTYEAIKWITEITETTEGLIVTLAFVIVASIVVPELVGKIAASSVGVLISKVVDWTKEKIGNILELVNFVDLIAIHEAMLVLWPKWREVFTPFQDAISALAEQLGQGTGYIHAWLSVGHGLSMVGSSLLNIDPKIGEIRAMETSQEFMRKLDEKFRAYAHDPGLIAQDIIEEIYIPYATEIQDTQAATIESIKDTREYALTLNQSLDALDDSLEYLVESTLPEFRDQMAENLKGMRDTINTLTDWIESEILPPIDLSIRVLSHRAEILERANAVARAKLDNPIEIFMATEFQDQATQQATYQYLVQMTEKGRQESIEGLEVGAVQIEAALTQAVEDRITGRPVPAEIVGEALRYELPTPVTAEAIPSWFQGEY